MNSKFLIIVLFLFFCLDLKADEIEKIDLSFEGIIIDEDSYYFMPALLSYIPIPSYLSILSISTDNENYDHSIKLFNVFGRNNSKSIKLIRIFKDKKIFSDYENNKYFDDISINNNCNILETILMSPKESMNENSELDLFVNGNIFVSIKIKNDEVIIQGEDSKEFDEYLKLLRKSLKKNLANVLTCE